MSTRFEWNNAKASRNVQKHGVRFADVEAVFYDANALSIADSGYANEQRFVVLGKDHRDRLLTVCYTYRGSAVRIISARRATRAERSQYEKKLRL